MTQPNFWIPRQTEDGSFTFFSEAFRETFHSQAGARDEAFQKFVRATDLARKSERPQLRLLDMCYGLGYNTAAALETIWSANPACHVTLHGFEMDETVPRAAIAPPLIDSWTPPVQAVLRAIAQRHHHTTPRLTATLWIGDARQTVQHWVQQDEQVDAIFFDPFSPRRCPQLWTVEFFTLMAQCLAPTGQLATYSRSASVRAALLEAGFCIGTLPLEQPGASHEWAQGTVAAFDVASLHPLSVMEQEHLQTRAAIPYRDPDLRDSADVILQRQQQEQRQSGLESTTRWRRRWGIQ